MPHLAAPDLTVPQRDRNHPTADHPIAHRAPEERFAHPLSTNDAPYRTKPFHASTCDA